MPNDAPRIARYAFSEIDYHTVIKSLLAKLETAIVDKYGSECINSNVQHSFVDSAPVLERRWAQKAGLGWIGKHTQLISPEMGSYSGSIVGYFQQNYTLVNEYDNASHHRVDILYSPLSNVTDGELVYES